MEQEKPSRVMIIDDNPFFAQVLKRLFETHGYQVVASARTVKEGTELYGTKKPDLITLDLMMKNEHGFRALMTLKRMEPNVRIIVISSDPNQLTMDKARDLGAVGYVVKPVKWEQLKVAVEQAEKK